MEESDHSIKESSRIDYVLFRVSLFAVVVAITFVVSSVSTGYPFDDETPFNQSEIINNGSYIGSEDSYMLYSKCEGNYSADDIDEGNFNSSWVDDNCWFVKKNITNQSKESDLTL